MSGRRDWRDYQREDERSLSKAVILFRSRTPRRSSMLSDMLSGNSIALTFCEHTASTMLVRLAYSTNRARGKCISAILFDRPGVKAINFPEVSSVLLIPLALFVTSQ